MGQNPSTILPETSGWDAEANEHPRIKWLYRILMGLGVLLGIAFGIGAYLYYTPVMFTGTDEDGKYEYGVQRYEYWRYENKEIRYGYETHWDTAGHIVLRRYWKKGKPHGIEESWYESGQIRNRCSWIMGKKTGLDQYWHSNGQLSYETNWIDDELLGEPKQWDENGNLLPLPKTFTLDIDDGIEMKFVLIPSGEFMMGSNDGEDDEKPVHKVRISQSFYIGQYEISQEQYEKIMGDNPSYFRGAKNPLQKVSWDNAQEFCKKLSEKSGYQITLPTEAQWEYACRAGSTGKWCFGDNRLQLSDYSWHGRSNWPGIIETRPVGQKKPNAWGLYDMHGPAWEWCWDYYDDRFYFQSPSVDPKGPDTGDARVIRGGDLAFLEDYFRSACRWGLFPDCQSYDIGFRVVTVPRDKK